jgi:UDP-N-acetylglucosamine 2-epimerase (non-hydrolysing)
MNDRLLPRVLCVIGTRPEAIKMSPVVRALRQRADVIESRVCITAQHREMVDEALRLFGIVPDDDLDIMRPGQTPTTVLRLILERLEPVLLGWKPDWVLVQGDTTTVMAAALLAFHLGIRIGHVEAGLRTGNLHNPFPEEANRRIADLLATLYFAPTSLAVQHLLNDGVPAARIILTGNTVVDALEWVSQMPFDVSASTLQSIPFDKRLILLTSHRRENFGDPLASICGAVAEIAEKYRESVHIVAPVHPNPQVQAAYRAHLGNIPTISLLPPLDYQALIHVMQRATLVLTDSGGLQEEAPSFGIPVLVLRETTERPEAVAAGTAQLIGTDRARIVAAAARLLDDPAAHRAMVRAENPFGKGDAAERIVQAILDYSP